MIKRFAKLVKLSHTIFALPFALIGYTCAICVAAYPFEWWVLIKILGCMLFARNAAMGFNRWVDRDIDAKNPRTAEREIPAGRISQREAILFVLVNAVLFMATASTINTLTAMLSPVALATIFFYSYCKRFTALAHLLLGLGLGIAPTAAYISVTGSFAIEPLLLSAVVVMWCAGFDIIYALQDRDFDIANGLHSIPSRFSVKGALIISSLLHCASIITLIAFALLLPSNLFIWIGVGLFSAIIISEHIIVTPSQQINIGIAFGTLNGLASIALALFVILGLVRGV